MNEYGSLGQIVATSGTIMATASAIVLAWKGRAVWEPSEEDIGRGPQKVSSLVIAVIITIIWVTSTPSDQSFLVKLSLALAGLTIVFLLVYGYLVGAQTYTKVDVEDNRSQPPKTKKEKIIGGFWLTPKAKEILQKKKELTIQELLKGAAYDPDKVWTPPSRSIAKQCFVIGYIGLVACGTVALAAVAILVGFKV